MSLPLEDPLAHRALQALVNAGSSVTRRLEAELERAGVSGTGFHMLVLLSVAGGELELRTLRRRLRTSKANASEVVSTLESRGLVWRERIAGNRRAALVRQTEAGRRLVAELFPGHASRVREAFADLDDEEKRTLAALCRKLAA